jgi:hypothetical protein
MRQDLAVDQLAAVERAQRELVQLQHRHQMHFDGLAADATTGMNPQ